MPQTLARAFELRGKLTEPDPNNPALSVRVVYQRTSPGLGNDPDDPTRTRQRRAYVVPINPNTPAQQTRRAKMAAAVLAWKTDPSPYLAEAQARAKRLDLPLYHAWISAYMDLHQAAPGTVFDGGATTWDGGATTWDAT